LGIPQSYALSSLKNYTPTISTRNRIACPIDHDVVFFHVEGTQKVIREHVGFSVLADVAGALDGAIFFYVNAALVALRLS
jgi:hypothetical protein